MIMAFYLNDIELEPGIGFTHNGIKYPGNWAELSTDDERKAIGITYKEEPPYDDRFYYLDSDSIVQPKPLAMLQGFWTGQVRKIAHQQLSVTDWYFIREADNGVAVNPAIKTWREMIRLAAGSKVYEIEHAADTAALAAYVTGPDYSAWPSQDAVPAPTPEEAITFSGEATGGQIAI